MSTTARPRKRISVLYVEDGESNIALMQMFFDQLGEFDLIVARTGEEGVRMARSHHPDIILMDINLPGISGTEAMQALHLCPECTGIPVIAISADALPELVTARREAGFDEYLTKPIDLHALADLIRKFVQSRR